MATKPHPIQALMDNPWVLLVLGILITAFFYTGWGWWDISSTPPATLP